MVLDRGNGGNWRLILAAFGCLILSVGREGAQAKDIPPVAEPGQAVESQPQREAQHEEEPGPKATWPRDIEAGEEASRAVCGTEENCRAEQRDYSDLRAQWQAAEAAKGQQRLAFWQTVIAAAATAIAGIGTIFLVWTLRETRRTADAGVASAVAAERAAKAADKAVEITIDTAIRQLRAYVRVEEAILNGIENDQKIHASIVIKNTGSTPAKIIVVKSAVAIVLTINPETIQPDLIPYTNIRGFIARDQIITHKSISPFKITEEFAELIRNETVRLIFFGSVVYEDIFSNTWELRYKLRSTGEASAMKSLLSFCEDGNEEQPYDPKEANAS